MHEGSTDAEFVADICVPVWGIFLISGEFDVQTTVHSTSRCHECLGGSGAQALARRTGLSMRLVAWHTVASLRAQTVSMSLQAHDPNILPGPTWRCSFLLNGDGFSLGRQTCARPHGPEAPPRPGLVVFESAVRCSLWRDCRVSLFSPCRAKSTSCQGNLKKVRHK